ncbi:hypothetical protein CDL12_12278 [Handroanthus impetiginosus]|uniref:Uncharacterized protein n=1 Tax=Handroanthus impetiginosus TaxID=429701 RepID=A0A2G9HC57_9LAMI|nr:hypothetical protein CDL12_12278 [Handroanthus impetiginosus]
MPPKRSVPVNWSKTTHGSFPMVLSVSFDEKQNNSVLVPYSSLTSIIISRMCKMNLALVIHHLKDERT